MGVPGDCAGLAGPLVGERMAREKRIFGENGEERWDGPFSASPIRPGVAAIVAEVGEKTKGRKEACTQGVNDDTFIRICITYGSYLFPAAPIPPSDCLGQTPETEARCRQCSERPKNRDNGGCSYTFTGRGLFGGDGRGRGGGGGRLSGCYGGL